MKTGNEILPSKQRAQIWLPLLIVVVVAAAYANSLSVPFVFDDNNHIKENPRIQKLWPLTQVLSATNRPVTDLTLAVNYHFGKETVAGYHLFNIALHTLNALLVMAILRSALLSTPPGFRNFSEKRAAVLSFFVAMLWAVHPIQTQSVTYIIQRSELLMGFFYLLTLYSVIRLHKAPQQRAWGVVAIFFCGLGMGSKEVMVTAPIVVMLYDLVFLSASWKEVLRKRWWVYLGLSCTWVVLFKFATAQRANALIGGFSFHLLSPWEYAVSQPGVICHYVRLMFWPAGLCLDYQWPLAKTAVEIVPCAIVILALITATGWALRYRPETGFWGGWFFLILAPTSSFMPIGDLAFEHRMYLSSLSVIVLIVLGADALLRRTRGIYGAGLFVLIAGILFAATVRRNAVYSDEEILWRDVLKKRPENMRAYQNLGVALTRKGKWEEGRRYLLKALVLNPINEKTHYNLAVALEQEGNIFEAQKHLKEAMRLNPDFFYAYLLLGKILLEMDDLKEAEPYLKKALELNPRNAKAHLYGGFLLFKKGQIDDALRHYDSALALSPEDAEVYYHAALAWAQQGAWEKSEEYFKKAIKLNPEAPLAHFNLGNILAQRGDYNTALWHFEACRRLKPDFKPVAQRLEQIRALLQ